MVLSFDLLWCWLELCYGWVIFVCNVIDIDNKVFVNVMDIEFWWVFVYWME